MEAELSHKHPMPRILLFHFDTHPLYHIFGKFPAHPLMCSIPVHSELQTQSSRFLQRICGTLLPSFPKNRDVLDGLIPILLLNWMIHLPNTLDFVCKLLVLLYLIEGTVVCYYVSFQEVCFILDIKFVFFQRIECDVYSLSEEPMAMLWRKRGTWLWLSPLARSNVEVYYYSSSWGILFTIVKLSVKLTWNEIFIYLVCRSLALYSPGTLLSPRPGSNNSSSRLYDTLCLIGPRWRPPRCYSVTLRVLHLEIEIRLFSTSFLFRKEGLLESQSLCRCRNRACIVDKIWRIC